MHIPGCQKSGTFHIGIQKNRVIHILFVEKGGQSYTWQRLKRGSFGTHIHPMPYIGSLFIANNISFLMHISHMRNECYVYIVSPQIMGTVNDSNTEDQYTVANVFESLGNSFDGSRKQMYSDILWTLFLFLS